MRIVKIEIYIFKLPLKVIECTNLSVIRSTDEEQFPKKTLVQRGVCTSLNHWSSEFRTSLGQLSCLSLSPHLPVPSPSPSSQSTFPSQSPSHHLTPLNLLVRCLHSTRLVVLCKLFLSFFVREQIFIFVMRKDFEVSPERSTTNLPCFE